MILFFFLFFPGSFFYKEGKTNFMRIIKHRFLFSHKIGITQYSFVLQGIHTKKKYCCTFEKESKKTKKG